MEKGKVLVTGASGLLGREVFNLYKEDGWEVTGLCFSKAVDGLVQHDVTDSQATRDLLRQLKPNLVVHCAAQRFPDKMEENPEESWNLNVTSNRTLSQVTSEVGGRLIYISTDYVFDGSSPPYTADSTPQPTNKYGQSKLEGENVVRENPSNIILRIPVLYGNVKNLKESALTVLLDTVRSGNPAKISSYEVRCPAHTKDIASILLDMGNMLDKIKGGVYQWSGVERLSKWDIVKMLAKEFDMSMDHLEEVAGASPGAPRPRDVELDRSKLEELGIHHHTTFKTGFLEAIKPFL
jgi:S-adenosylmethionine synthetase